MQRRNFILAAGAAAATVAAPWVRAQSQQPLRIVVGFAPGGGTDILARIISQKLSDMWKMPVVVENKAGAAGVIAADYVSKQPADGNTVLMAHINSHGISPGLQPNMPYNAERDFTPLVLVGVTPNLLICNDSQIKSVKGMIEACKKNPNKISFGSAGIGSSQHLCCELFKLRAGVEALHIPYKGSAPMLVDLIAGQINYSFDTMTAATPHVKSGKAIALAQTRTRRSKAYPNVPTMDESGFPGFDATTWYGLVGPAKLPAAFVKRLNEDVNRIMAMPDVVAKLEQNGAEDGGGSPEKFGEFMHNERVKWAKVIKDAKVTPEG
jgi:tripartite-type tricarboxylate transporter receptor subunit TctC